MALGAGGLWEAVSTAPVVGVGHRTWGGGLCGRSPRRRGRGGGAGHAASNDGAEDDPEGKSVGPGGKDTEEPAK